MEKQDHLPKKTADETDESDGRKYDYTDNPEKVIEEVEEAGGPKGPEPTRFGDWEVAGRCTDF
jgi:hypothetical protein